MRRRSVRRSAPAGLTLRFARALSGSLLLALIACSGTEPPDDDPPADDPPDSDPPGTQIVFQASDDIHVVNADGSGLTRLTDHPDPDVVPSWSSDGRLIYFRSYRGGRGISDLYSMNPDGTDVRLVTDSVYSPYDVSPDGTRIAFGAQQVGAPGYPNLDLFVMKADGSERTLILDLPCPFVDEDCEQLNALDWSPDGQRIAYSARWPGHGGNVYGVIGIVNADGTGHRVLTSTAVRSTDPAWSPDGQRIVFSSGETGTIIPSGLDIKVINADGSGEIVVLESGADISSPSWSPDGQSIVFAQTVPQGFAPEPKPSELYVIHTDGTGLRRVIDAPGDEFAPDWNPAGP